MKANRLIRDDDDNDDAPVVKPYVPAPEQTGDTRPVLQEVPVTAKLAAPVASGRHRPQHGRGPYAGRRQITADIDPILFKRLKMESFQTERPLCEIYEVALWRYAEAFAAEQKYASEVPKDQRRIARKSAVEGCPITAHVQDDLFKWLRAIHMQTRKTKGLILEEALIAHVNSSLATRKFGVEN